MAIPQRKQEFYQAQTDLGELKIFDRYPYYRKMMAEKVSIVMGALLMLLGFIGFVERDFLGMHLSLPHNLLFLLMGAFSLGFGVSNRFVWAVRYCAFAGAFFVLIGLGGFLAGQEGIPSLIPMVDDNFFWPVLPGAMEFTTNDHIFHLLVAAVFLWAGYSLRARKRPLQRVK